MQSDGISVYHIVRGTILLLAILAGIIWIAVFFLKRSDDPPRLLVKMISTALIAGVVIWVTKPFSDKPYNIVDLNVSLLSGLALAIIWRHSIGAVIAKPFTALYDGGSTEVEPRPFYSIAEAKRKKGLYREAIAEIRKQLAKFPTDYQGQLLLAEIQAENMNDVPGAEVTVQRLCEQPGHAPRNIAFALNSLADWHLKYAQDREAAQQSLEKVISLFPDSELAHVASQRIAHLASTDRLLEPYNRQKFTVREGIKDLGLRQSTAQFVPTAKTPEAIAAEYVNHLQQFPMDAEAREKLAVIYADHYKRMDLAEDQLNQLIELPNQPVKSVVRWLNLLADLQVKHDKDHEAAKQTLERIIEKFPTLPAAELARNRMDLLKLEFKGKQKSQVVKLGSYEQDIGLKQGSPRQL